VAIGITELKTAIRQAGLANRAVCLHSSLASHGHVDGGASALVDAFLTEGTSLVVPAFTRRYAVTPPPHLRPPRNGTRYDGWPAQGGLPVHPTAADGTTAADGGTAADGAGGEFSPAGNDTNMGAVPREVLARAGRQRGNHPLCSFAAIGPGAAGLVRGQSPIGVFAPLAALAAQDGLVALAGVGLDRMTLIHYAEQVAGRVLFRRWACTGGQVAMVAVGGCSRGFERFAGALRPVETTVTAGLSRWRVFPAAETVGIVADIIRRDPGSTRCSRRGCQQCADAVFGGPIVGG
jgi:aminoglycoside N3'-acetyltransferase